MCFIIAYPVFVPSRGFLFFYRALIRSFISAPPFSSPHGDFSFSMCELVFRGMIPVFVFVPSRGFLFFYTQYPHFRRYSLCFRPLTGISLFLFEEARKQKGMSRVFVPSRGFLFFYAPFLAHLLLPPLQVFVPSRGFLFFYKVHPTHQLSEEKGFRPLTGISLFLWSSTEAMDAIAI